MSGAQAAAGVTDATAAATPPGGSDTYVSPGGVRYQRVADASAQPVAPATPAAAVTQPAVAVADPAKPVDPAAAAAKDAPLKVDDADPAKPKEGDAPAEITKPEDYKLTLPDGVTADAPGLKDFLTTAVAHKLPTETVQALVAEWAPKMAVQTREAQANAWVQTVQSWQTQAKSDPEIGGPKWQETVSRVTAALNKWGRGPDGKATGLQKFLNDTGAHSHPEFIRFVNRMAMPLSEGGPVTGGGGNAPSGTPPARDPASVMYPTHSAQG